jgi:hypothetical protein
MYLRMKAASVQERTTSIKIYGEFCFLNKEIKTTVDHCHPRVRKSLSVNAIRIPNQNNPPIAMI